MKKQEILREIKSLIKQCLGAYPDSARDIFNIVNDENATAIDALQQEHKSICDLFIAVMAADKLSDKRNTYRQLLDSRIRHFLERGKYHTHGAPLEVRLYDRIKNQTESPEQ